MIIRLIDDNGRATASAILDDDGSWEMLADDEGGNFRLMLRTIDQMVTTSAVEHRGVAVWSAVHQIVKTIPGVKVFVEGSFILPHVPRRAVV